MEIFTSQIHLVMYMMLALMVIVGFGMPNVFMMTYRLRRFQAYIGALLILSATYVAIAPSSFPMKIFEKGIFANPVVRKILIGETELPRTANVVYYELKENEYILVLMKWGDITIPRYFKLPWNDEVARQLVDAANERQRPGSDQDSEITMHFPLSNNGNNENSIYVTLDTPPRPPSKPRPAPTQEF